MECASLHPQNKESIIRCDKCSRQFLLYGFSLKVVLSFDADDSFGVVRFEKTGRLSC